MDIVDRICGGFIYLFPKYRGMWEDVVEFRKKYPNHNPHYSYKHFFLHNTHIGIFFSDYHYPKGLLHKLWYYIGGKNGWLNKHLKKYDENKKKNMKLLEDCLTPQLKRMLEEEEYVGMLDGNHRRIVREEYE